MFGKKKKIIAISKVILECMEAHIVDYKEGMISLMTEYGEEASDDIYEIGIKNIIKRYRTGLLEDVIDKFSSAMPSINNKDEFMNCMLQVIPQYEVGTAEDFINLTEAVGVSPARILMTYFYAMYNKRLSYGEARPLNVMEQELFNDALHEVDQLYPNEN